MSTKMRKLEKILPEWVAPEELSFHLALMRELYSRANPSLLEQLDEESLIAVLSGAIRLLDGKHPHDIRVRASNPRHSFDGWEGPYTALEATLTDRPFIVDSITHELKRLGLHVRHVLHPIFRLGRDERGRLQRVENPHRPYLEAYQLFLLAPVPDGELAAVETRVERVLQDVKLATDSYLEMRRACGSVAAELLAMARHPLGPSVAAEVREGVDFLEWLERDNFIYLGYDYVDWSGATAPRRVPERALGLMLSQLAPELHDNPVPLCNPPDELALALSNYPLLNVSESPTESLVHRPARLDRIVVKLLNPRLEMIGEHTFLGLFTSNALRAPLKDIPLLRHRLKEVLCLDKAIKGSHDYKRIVSIADSMPREELFWSLPTELHRDIRMLMGMGEGEIRVALRQAPNKELLVLVAIPRDRYSAKARRAIERVLLDGFRAGSAAFHLAFDEENEQARLHFLLHHPAAPLALDATALEALVLEATRTWHESLTDRLVAARGAEQGHHLAMAFAQGFGEGYLSENSLDMALRDIAHLVSLQQDRQDRRVDWRVAIFDLAEESVLRIYHTQEALVLSDVLPMLENLGLRVLAQSSYPISYWHERDEQRATIDTFRVKDRRTGSRLEGDEARLAGALQALLEGQLEDRRVNGLILYGGLTWPQVNLLASYAAYLSQISVATSRHFIVETLLAHPECAALIAEGFETRFRPDVLERGPAMASVETRFLRSLEKVGSLAQDRILRSLMRTVQATVRSNFYLGKSYLAHKIDSRQIDEMPEPRPVYEIFVMGSGVEGVHLRGGLVARGGVRWSDRPDDFRTEVLGLMKTQMAKNAVIVPVGSKGGFVLKRSQENRERLADHLVEQYRIFIRGLLDLTDNYRDGQIVAPPDLVLHDGPDPYLVVAADKGTARLSDVANEVAAEYGFWLGDAFASGGTFGYDHKKEGITARGAWECVKRHFYEMGIDATTAPLTCVGIGDMSGDVFGNGMLYSERILLQAAFNHQHIFLDPAPDPAVSYRERQRLFAMPGSSWSDYNEAFISAGGGVFARAAKSITLSREVREMLRTEREELTGEELVNAVLSMPVDLLWNGGIGTYVRASQEGDSAAEDAANDAVRIPACQLRALVVGEGGNGGFTQAARVEYARAGGRINTDAIDNSAGVDLSDHEVNIKILMQDLVASGELTLEERNLMLTEMTAEVTAAVLADNFWQSLCLSLEQRRCAQLTRPELAIGMAAAKLELQEQLLESSIPEDPLFEHYLTDYFPWVLHQRYHAAISEHALRREIVATQMANAIVNLLGTQFIREAIDVTGMKPAQTLQSVLTATELLEIRGLLERVTAVELGLPADALYRILEGLGEALESVSRWILLTDAVVTVRDRFDSYRQQWRELLRQLESILPPSLGKRLRTSQQRLESLGMDAELSAELAMLEYAARSLALVDFCWTAGEPVHRVARRYFELGERLRIDWLQSRLSEIAVRDRWSSMARAGLLLDLRRAQLRLAPLEVELDGLPGQPLSRFLRLVEEVERDGPLDQASGDVLARMLGHIAEAAHRYGALQQTRQAQVLTRQPRQSQPPVPERDAVAH